MPGAGKPSTPNKDAAGTAGLTGTGQFLGTVDYAAPEQVNGRQADSSYHLISLRRVSYRGYNAADWEFTEDYPATLDQFADRGFIVRPGALGFAIELYGPPARFQSVYASMWRKLVTSFEPAP